MFTEKFTTAHLPDPSIQFHKVALPTAEGVGFTSVVFGPGHKLYAGTDEGRIFIYNVLPDGTLSEPEKITSLQTANNAQRLITGFCFDPRAPKPIRSSGFLMAFARFTIRPIFREKSRG